jgi:hypothetical protein
VQAAAEEKLLAADADRADLAAQREGLEARVAALQAEAEGLQRDLLTLQVLRNHVAHMHTNQGSDQGVGARARVSGGQVQAAAI